MKKALILGALGLAMVVFGVVRAGAAGTPTPKIGYVDFQNTIDKTRKAKQSELDKKQKDLQKAAAELDKQAPILKPDVLAQKKGELEKKFVELQQVYMKLERDLAGERTKLIQDLLKKAGPIIEEIAKAEGVQLIVDQSAVLWADPGVDLTAKLNAKMK